MKFFKFAFFFLSVFFCLTVARNASAGSCADPVYLATHVEACWDEFSECFDGYDSVWDAAMNAGNIVVCIQDSMEEEAEELVEDIIEEISGDENSQAEDVANDILNAIFGINNETDAILDQSRAGWGIILTEARNGVVDGIRFLQENRRNAKENLEALILKLIKKRHAKANELRSRLGKH